MHAPHSKRSVLFAAIAGFVLFSQTSCNSPKALTDQTKGVRSISQTLGIIGVGGTMGSARNPISGAIRGMHHAAAIATTLATPGMPLFDTRSGPPLPVVKNRPGMDMAKFEAELDRKLNPVRSRGTVKLLIDGDEFFPTLSRALSAAREPIDVQVYIFDNDDVALKVADELKAASMRVPVRVLFDELGSQQASNVEAGSGNPPGYTPPADMLAYLKRGSKVDAHRLHNPFLTSTHTKIIAIGPSHAFTGGMNIGREYRYDWHDMMAELRGPVVGELRREVQRSFKRTRLGSDFTDLLTVSGDNAEAKVKTKAKASAAEPAGAYDIRVLRTRPFRPQIERAIHLAIRSAQRRIWIENPYFADDTIARELIAARARGVDVRVVLPLSADTKIMGANNLATAAVLLKYGIRVYSFPRKHHLKAALFDDWALMGSANLDHLSLRLNEEVNIAYSHPTPIREIESRLFQTDFGISKELTIDSVKPSLTDLIAELVADGL
jgi:cardiolipin synthase